MRTRRPLADAPPEVLAVSGGGVGKCFRGREAQAEAAAAATVQRAWYGWRTVSRAGYVSAGPLAGMRSWDSGRRGGREGSRRGLGASPRVPDARRRPRRACSAARDAGAARRRLVGVRVRRGPRPPCPAVPACEPRPQGPPRQRLAQGHPAAADRGGPERLEIQPGPSAGLGGGVDAAARRGVRAEAGRKAAPEFRRYLSLGVTCAAVSVPCCHLPLIYYYLFILAFQLVPCLLCISFHFVPGAHLGVSTSVPTPCFCLLTLVCVLLSGPALSFMPCQPSPVAV